MAKVEEIPLDALVPDAANARRRTDKGRSAISASLRQFGAGRSIVLDCANVVRAGNGTIEQAQAEGFDRVLVVEPEPGQIVAVRRPDWTATQATAYGIADNRTTDLSTFDEPALASLLEAIRSEPDYPVEATGFTDGEIDDLLGSLGEQAAGKIDGEAVDDPLGEWQGMPECENEDQAPFRSLHVHFASEEDVRRFGEAIGQEIPDRAPSLWFPARAIERLSSTPYVNES
jgi:hypothetical protein